MWPGVASPALFSGRSSKNRSKLLRMSEALHWYPPVGVFIAILGVLGIVVPLIRDLAKMGKWEKAIWTFVMFALMGLEIRSIYLDRTAHDIEQDKARAEQLQHFNEIGEGIKGAVAESQKQFDATMERSNTILGGVSESIKQQRGLFDRQQEMIESFNGHLVPGNQPMPPLASLGCMNDWVPNDAYLIRIGEMTQVVEEFPVTPLGVDIGVKGTIFATTHELVRISKRADGVLVMALDLRDKDGVIIVKLNADGIEVGPQFHVLHPDKSTLVIEDSHGKEVLRIVYVMKRYLWLRTQMIVNGETIADTTMFQHFCMPPVSGGGVRIFKPSS